MSNPSFLLTLTLGLFFFLVSCDGRFASASSTKTTSMTKSATPETPIGNPATPGEPDIDFDERSLNLGTIEPGGKKETIIKIYNRGSKELLISQVRSSCGCTSTLLGSKGPIKPKEFQELKIVVESKEGKPVAPKSNITIISNDPAEPTCNINTTIIVKSYFEFEPKALNLGQVLQGDVLESQFVVFSPEKHPIRIQKIVPTDPQIQVTVGESTMLPNQKLPGVVVKVSILTQHRPVGNFRGTLEVHFDHEKQKTALMTLFGVIGGEILLKTGDRVMNAPLYDLGTVPNARGPLPMPEPRKIRVALHEKSTRTDLKVLQIIGEPGPFQLEAVPNPTPRSPVEIAFINNGTARAGLFRQHFKLLVNHPSVPILEFCLQGSLQGNLNFSAEGFYVETPPNQPFEQKISIRQNLQAPPKLEIHGGKFLQYEMVPEANTLWLIAKSAGCENSFMEEVEIKDLTSGEVTPITVWVEVLK